ncbi:hypothetical protein LWI29_030732 [Acer saccharum]|uniref:RRM domain-containing protein n=1 Tax=Acer saccharum TaxID=4024 RepID=A0AA39REI5_ACESA|nr:hypothetical protein LWI29_030732 [Acer saccharum]
MQAFARYGALDSVTTYSSRSFAFVFFKRVEDAKAAKDALQRFPIRGNPIKIEFARPGSWRNYFQQRLWLNPCVLESDGAEMADLVLNVNLRNASYGSILSEIAYLISHSNSMNISAISSSTNQAAQHLANFALESMRNTYWMEDFPFCIKGLVEADKSF